MHSSQARLQNSLGKAFLWLVTNTLFGLAPLLFLLFINALSEVNVALREIDQVMAVAAILFVCCALTGSVMIEYLLSKIKVKGRLSIFAVYVSPLFFILYLFLKYLFVYLQLDNQHEFGPGATATKLAVAFSFVYCLSVKTLFYLNRDNAGYPRSTQ